MRWVFHIGIQKTGSKAIQSFLATQAAMIPDARVCFPEHGKDLNLLHESVYWALLEGDGRHLEAAAAEADPEGWDIGVFSCELLHELPPPSLQVIRDSLGDVQIVLFIRHQADAVNSLLNQYVKARRVSYDEIIEFEQNIAKYNPKFDYQAITSRWADAFGEAAITPIIYDKQTDVVSLFCEAIGISLPAQYQPANNVNLSLTLDAYEKLLSAKASIADAATLPGVVDRLLRGDPAHFMNNFQEAGPPLFDDEVHRKIISVYAASNEAVRRRWFSHRPTLF